MGLSVFPAPASGPTLSEINNSISTLAPSPNNWTLLSTYTINNTSSAFTISGLSGYKSYRFVAPALNTGGLLAIRINGDTTSAYSSGGLGASGNNVFLANSFYRIFGTPASGWTFNATISEAHTAGNKSITVEYADNNSDVYRFEGSYGTTNPVNSITVFNNSGGNFTALNAAANLIHFYGAN